MNQADSEKINMVLLQSGFIKVKKWQDANLVIFNTCSVRKKWEDRVFWMLQEIKKENEKRCLPITSSSFHWSEIIITWITGCMVRKTGLAKKYMSADISRDKAKKIEYLSEERGIFNNDDKLFPRCETLDFTLRIEETKYLPHILTHIYGERIGQEDKFDDYLKQVGQRENPHSANIIIQTGCDNYCTFCIVPYTRWGEISRPAYEILSECKEVAANWATEVTLLGQNVNSYGKQFVDKRLWNEEKNTWNTPKKKLKIGIDLDETLLEVWCPKVLEAYNRKFHDIIELDDITSYDFNGIHQLQTEYRKYGKNNSELSFQQWATDVLRKLHNSGHQLYIVTSRDVDERVFTTDFLEKEFWEDFFTKIIFIRESGEDLKYKAAQEHKLDIVLDDADHHIQWYQENCPETKVVVFSQSWNQDIITDNISTYRIENWGQFLEIIEKSYFVSPFYKLLSDIDQIPWIDRIRFTSSNPHDMTPDILDSHFNLSHSCNYLHFALQSGNDAMLKKMNRKHNYKDFLAMVQYLRSRDPLFSISTDIIVGYSGETEEMFEDTITAFKECQFDFVYIARYSVRPWTLAAKMYPDDVPETVKAERWHILNSLLLESVQKRNKLMIGRTEEILISWEKDDWFFWRTRNFKEVFIEKGDNVKIGDLLSVEITKLDKYVLLGKQI